MSKYAINEIFETLQGEGVHAGRYATFVRFAGCNLACSGSWSNGVYQPVCDTEFTGVAHHLSLDEIADCVGKMEPDFVVLTGGEPALQVDQCLVDQLSEQGHTVAIETNGTKSLPLNIDHVTVSPKTADHTIVVRKCHELRYVLAVGQPIPKTTIEAEHRFVSPAREPDGTLKRETLEWTIEQIKQNQKYRLSIQSHKLLSMR